MPSNKLPDSVVERIGKFWLYDEEHIAKRVRRLERSLPPEKQKVAFVIAGVQKGGTTVLKEYMDNHPELLFGRRKEIHFFDTPELFASDPPDYRPYHAYFHAQDGRHMLGEATPEYVYAEGAMQRIHAYNPAMKNIVILRNPIDRAYSHWNMSYSKGHDSRPFSEVIGREPAGESGGGQPQSSYIDRGFYSGQIETMRQFFPAVQTLILRQEDLRHDHNAMLSTIWDFLGVEPIGPVESLESNVGTYSARMTDEDRAFLRDLYRDEIKALESLLGWDCSNWLK